MKRLLLVLSLLLAAAAVSSSAPRDAVAGMQMPWRTPLHKDLMAALPDVCPGGTCRVLGVERQSIDRQLAHYSILLQTGPGPFDSIKVHRVVKEIRPWVPRKARDTVLLQHGDTKDFAGMFLPGNGSTTRPAPAGLALYLARNRVDVWGIDQAWALVPAGTTDFSFMADWGIQRQTEDLSLALSLARGLRRTGGNRHAGMQLLGYGGGAIIGFALLNAETALPATSRKINGFVAMDMTFRTNSEALRAYMCTDAEILDERHAAGIYQSEAVMCSVGSLCSGNPGGPSPYFPGMTNHQAALFLGAGPTIGETEIHNVAGFFDGEGIPIDLLHTSQEGWLDYMSRAVPYQPVQHLREQSRMLCGQTDHPFDDSIGEVQVPVLYLSAGGGFGPHGDYGLYFMPKARITSHLIQLEPPARVNQDFGHVDLLTAANAPELAWEPVLGWIRENR